MNRHARLGGVLVTLALFVSACGGAPVAQAPTAAPAAPAVQPTAAPVAQPTAAFEKVNDAEPTVGAIANAAAPAVGTLSWRDQVLSNDVVALSIDGLTPPTSGNGYAAWLANKDQSLPLGALTSNENGGATLIFSSPEQQNLLGAFDHIYITQAPQAELTTNASGVVLGGTLPEKALVHIRHLLFSIGVTPGKIGFVLGLRQETDELLRHAQFLRDAYDANDFALEKVHAEHLINIIRGSEARDANGDGKIQNPGDGYGLLPNGQQDGYIKGMTDHAKLAADAPDATAAIKLHAGHVQIVGENTRQRVDQVRALAEQVLAAESQDKTQQPVLAVLALAQQTIQGIDINGDEQVGPIPGEGGVLTAYQHAQLMAGITLAPETGTVALAPIAAPAAEAAAVPTSAAAPAPAAPAPAASVGAKTVKIAIGDNSFEPKKLTVSVGTTIVWTNAGQRPHTVTADNGAFTSGNMDKGATFTFTFTKAGTFPYYCEYHGGAGSQGMAATIIVSDGSAVKPAPAPAAPPAKPAPTAAPAAPAASANANVEIGDNSFNQKEISVPVGTTVTWMRVGQRPHTVTADDGSFKSDTLKNGDMFTHTFDKPGVYAYYCTFHGAAGGQGMSGVVKVGDAPAVPTAVPAAPTAVSAAPAAAALTISMKDFSFDAPEVHVKAGTLVTWKNEGAKRHSATAVDGSFDTGLYGSGESKTVTLDKPGRYTYFCQLHGAQDGKSGMVGTIIVDP